MIGGGGRRTGAGARRFSVEKDRKTLRGLLETVAGDVTAGAGTFVAGLADMTAVTAATAVTPAAAAEFSLTAIGDGDDADVRPAALFDVISFGAVVETTGVKVAAFDGRLLDVSCDVILYAVAGC